MLEESERAEICLFCKELHSESQNVPRPRPRPRRHFNSLPREDTQTSDNWRHLFLSEVKSIGKELGRGAYGRVFEVKYGTTLFAAKEVHALLIECAQDDQTAMQNIKDSFFNECHIWSQLEHPCIVQFIGVFYDPVSDKLPIIVLEKMHNSLRGLVEKHSDVIPFSNILSILNDVGLGLQYLHSRTPPIVHRDLTPNNILLCYHLRAKITDLGVAKIMQTTDSQTLTQAPGTQCFMPPESLADNPVYGLPLDIFSLGGVILYIATQQWPIPAAWVCFDPDTGKKIVLTELERRQSYLNKMTGIFTILKPLAVSCLDDNPKNRPSVSQVLLDIKKAKNVYYEKFFSAIWGTKFSGQQELNPQLQNPHDQLPMVKLHKQEKQYQQKSDLQQRQQQQQQQQQEEVQLLQKPEEGCQQLNEQQLPQPVLSSGGGKGINLPEQVEQNYPLFIGLFDYSAKADSDLSFKKGDLLYVLSTDESEHWWLARAKHSDQEGYIPSNYVAEFKSLDTKERRDLAQKLPNPRSELAIDEWEIDRTTLRFDRKLGVGNFSEVWLGLWNNSSPVFIKKLKPAEKFEVADFVTEAKVMKKLCHPNLLQLYGVCTLEEPILVVTEFMKYGALLDYLHKGEGRNLKLPELISMAAQIAGGMAYLEEHSYIHRYLAARSILVGDDYLCKIVKDVYDPREDTKFTDKWTAPEAAVYNKFSIKSDIWSFGVVIYELLTKGAMPYPGMNNRQVLEAVERGYRMPPPDDCPDALYNIMLSCWKHEADDRPTFEFLKYQLEDYFVIAGSEVYYTFVP